MQNAADTRIVPGDKSRDSVQNAPSVSAYQGPAEGQRGGGGNRRGTVESGQWAVGSAHQRCAGTRCNVHCGAGGCRVVRPCLVGGQAAQQPISSINNPLLCASPQRGRPALAGGVGLSGAVVTWEAVHSVVGKGGVGAAGTRGRQRVAAAAGRSGRREGKLKGGKEVREPSAP